MSDFLLELLSEEIPARMQDKAVAELERLFLAEIGKAGLAPTAIERFVTPRRLALIARGLPEATEPVRQELKGPRADAPEAAIAGFLGKTGLRRDQLEARVDAKGNAILFATLETPGRPTAAVLAELVPALMRGFAWPKAMRWGEASRSTESLRWVRPLQAIVALFGREIVPCAVAGIEAGRVTAGHRFLHSGGVSVASPDAYVDALRAAYVLVDAEERRRLVREGAAHAAREAGLTLVEDEGLVAENAGLTEWPVPLLGRFDPAFLAVPREVIQLTLRTNQKYFVCTEADGALAPAFVCTANIAASDGGAAIVAGNAKVLAARLADARFFWEQDLKVPLESQAARLGDIVFHQDLGTLDAKVERVARLARALAEQGLVPGADPALAEQAARLAKADLVTQMVGEFPELQGVMGGYYAAAAGLDPQVAEAIRDQYKPLGQADPVPTAPVTVALSLADKLDTLSRFFAAGIRPTGSKDPFALRRAAVQIIAQILASGIRAPLGRLLALAAEAADAPAEDMATLLDFFADRLKVQQREAGIRHDLIDAVFALGDEDDLVRLLARVRALQGFVASEEGADLLAGTRRAANILRAEAKKQGGAVPAFTGFAYAPDPAEAALAEALDVQLPKAEARIAEEEFAKAMTALSMIRPQIDRFFDDVTVNTEDEVRRTTRLALLARLVEATRKLADFSRIEG
ncbi:glycine--tRNA ligase subunit beta [Sphingomonas morindae]|uniref:Glycine--tRNA ligase beta subunit n=1 Tax=Sphingomonas morindae TaxID=1541170 RepID=A0ABY4X5V4_9SPHN|nr:glycine--tRNA ligase subunit beta [Sphingomonas morindae]USI72265.1 glycine--tRNA ligase subunit beta [Sphingomonas morindae]